MAKINPYELINQQYTNANGDTYRVKAYIGKDSKLKHLYTIQFIDTKHEQHEERTKIINAKCRDLMKEKANKSKIKQKFNIEIPYWKDGLDDCLKRLGERR